MEKPPIQERLIMELQKISMAIHGITGALGMLESERKFPVQDFSKEFRDQVKENEKRRNEQQQLNLAEKQITNLIHQNKILVWTMIASIIVGVANVLVLFFKK